MALLYLWTKKNDHITVQAWQDDRGIVHIVADCSMRAQQDIDRRQISMSAIDLEDYVTQKLVQEIQRMARITAETPFIPDTDTPDPRSAPSPEPRAE